MDDTELLREFAGHGSEDAFRALVERHINLVYSAARQTARDPHLAEEVVQTVFVILARKARRLGHVTALSPWLYRATRLAAMQAVRNECRRREREEKFAAMDHTSSEETWQHIEPHLGETMDQLSESDRAALVLRFFESKSLKDVGRTLGTGEDAARMRVNRALEKMRSLFARRGVTVSAATLLAALTTNGVQAAPAGLAAHVAAGALTQSSAVTTSALVKGTLKVMAWTKIKTVAVTGAALLLFGGTTAVLVNQTFGARSSALSTDRKAVIASAETLVSALARGDADAFAAGLFARDDAGRRLAASYGVVAGGMADLNAALRERFGDTDDVWRIRYTFSMMSGIPLLGYQGQRTKVEVANDDAFFRSALWGFDSIPLHFVRANGEWKLLMYEGSLNARRTDEGVAMNEEIARQHHDFAREIRSGRFASPLEAWLAWAQATGKTGYTDLPRPSFKRPRP